MEARMFPRAQASMTMNTIGKTGTAGRIFSMRTIKRIFALTGLIVGVLVVSYLVFTYGALQEITI